MTNHSSRVGSKPINIPSSVFLSVDSNVISIHRKSDDSYFHYNLPSGISTYISSDSLSLIFDDHIPSNIMGLNRARLSNLILGIVNPFKVDLDIVGVGYKASFESPYLSLSLGFSHPIKYSPPPGVDLKVSDSVSIVVSGHSKDMVGLVVSDLTSVRSYNPYSGKGVIVKGKTMIRRESKR